MTDKYGWNESGKRIRDAIPSEVTLTEDHRAILRASGHLIHANALVENQQEQIERLTAEVWRLQEVADEAENLEATNINDQHAMDMAQDALWAALDKYRSRASGSPAPECPECGQDVGSGTPGCQMCSAEKGQ